jgi:LDH2 family malate/lactate/ureidoglycolate dehydrogenase
MQSEQLRVSIGDLDAFCRAALAAAGGDDATADAATRAMMHASRSGIDSHGVRLLEHYAKAIAGGRVNGKPKLRFVREFGATSMLDADDGHGALAAYAAMDRAIELARKFGTGSVAIRNSSHLGAAGAYVLAPAEQGMMGFCVCNADAIVKLHDGAAKFHGTNPIAFAAPVPGARPWLLDIPTSSMPLQRVNLYRSLGRALPQGVASDANGRDTEDPNEVKMLAPLGGSEFGYKGAGLAGMVEILSTAITGMGLSFELGNMVADLTKPRHLGAFVMAVEPTAFVERDVFDGTMKRYMDALHASPAQEGRKVMAPGDREWAQAAERAHTGIPIDPETAASFARLTERFGLRELAGVAGAQG